MISRMRKQFLLRLLIIGAAYVTGLWISSNYLGYQAATQIASAKPALHCGTYPIDCICGDGVCLGYLDEFGCSCGESTASCPADCPVQCNFNNFCDPGELYGSCSDCTCGN